MFGKILVFELQAKMLSANQVAGFFKLQYLLNYMRYHLDFLYVGRHPLLLQIDHANVAWQVEVWLRVWPGILGHAQIVRK